jgi:hypothetical protein
MGFLLAQLSTQKARGSIVRGVRVDMEYGQGIMGKGCHRALWCD